LQREVAPRVDDLQRGREDAVGLQSIARELISEHQPERRVIFIARIARRAGFGIADDLSQAVGVVR
jgi:hypothetical protein